MNKNVFMFNAQSVPAHYDEIVYFVETYEPSILLLTETHLTEDIIDGEIGIEGYGVVRVDSNSRHTGGVMCYINTSLRWQVIDSYIMEGSYWLLVMRVNGMGDSFLLVGVYRSPGASKVQFLDFFEMFCEELIMNGGRVVIMGDFNIDWRSDQDTYSKRLIKCVIDLGMVQVVKDYTHMVKDGRTMIDLVITNDRRLEVGIMDEPSYMNHRTIKLELKLEEKGRKTKRIRKQIVSERETKEMLSKVWWGYNVPDVNKKCDEIMEKIERVRNIIMPERDIVVRKMTSWFSDKVRESIKIRNRAHQRWNMSTTHRDWEEYRKRRNETVKLIRSEKQGYYERKIEENRYSTDGMWKTLKELTGGKNTDNTGDIVKFQGVVHEDASVIAEKFNNYFIESVEEIISTIGQNRSCVLLQNRDCELLNFRFTDENELKRIVFSLANKSSPDGVTIQFIKKYWEELKNPLVHIINSSIEKCTVPKRLKISVIIPIRKVKKTVLCEEFRPINTLPAVEKILEKVIYSQVERHVREKDVLSKFQSGFREKYSCETALQCVVSEWKECRDRGETVVVVFLDLKRAFETIDRKILIDKLYAYGIRGNCLEWLRSYIEDRKQKVLWGNKESVLREIKVGVPQGSVLGPLLFALYMNDIGDCLKLCKYHCFADDTVIYVEGKNVEELVEVVNGELKDLNEWLSVNELKLNIKKTKAMCISNDGEYRRMVDSRSMVTIDGEQVEFVKVIKYLGIMVDCRLNFREHVDYVSKKIGKRLGVIGRCRDMLTVYARHMLYSGIVLPMFHCCATILYLCNSGDVDRLQRLQNRGMRVILRCNRYTKIRDMLKCLGWLNIGNLLEYQTMIFIYRIITGNMPSYFDKYRVYCRDMHGYETRGKDNLYIKTAGKGIGYNSVFVRGFIRFNELDDSIKNATSLRLFKIRLKEYYRNCQLIL